MKRRVAVIVAALAAGVFFGQERSPDGLWSYWLTRVELPAESATEWKAVLDDEGAWHGIVMTQATDEDGGETAWGFAWGVGRSAQVRVDVRTEGGGRLAARTETLSSAMGAITCDGAAVGTVWKTSALADGWHTLAAGALSERVLTLNDSSIEVVGGRLTKDTQWGGIVMGPITYVVRHWVVVPKDVRLTIATDAAVKFAPGAGFWVEDGGAVVVVSLSPGEGAVFTALADDTVRGDTNFDGAASAPEAETWRVVLAPGATLADGGQLLTRHGAAMPRWGSVTLKDAVASERDAEVRVPITVSGSRGLEYVEWEAVDGSAKAGEDYVAASGRLCWGVGAAATQYAMIPLVKDGVTEETETFSVRLKAAWGLNVTRESATVTLNDASETNNPFAGFDCAEGASAPVRVDARTTFGGALAHGVETLGGEVGAIACDGAPLATNVWDSATVTDGAHTLTWGELSASVATLNAPNVAMEGGRLAANAEWGKAKTHVVRHWVVVPKDVTLTVTEGTVVKFAPGTGIWVEDGGTLRVTGSEAEIVTFTHGADADFGARVSFGDEVPEMNAYAIVKAPGGTFEDNGWLAVRWLDVATFGRVTLHPATAPANAGEIRIPVTVSGTREAPFTVRWVAEDDSAKRGVDYLLAEGVLSWASTKEGTKYIIIPTRDNPENTGMRSFKVRVLTACGMNAATEPVAATLYRNGAEALMEGAWGVAASQPVRVDGRFEEPSGRLARGLEPLTETLGALTCDGATVAGTWESAAFPDGWHTLAAGTNAVEALTLNAEGLAVEGGRLMVDTTWTDATLHVVRHWVVVPQGVTLKVTAGTVVKFATGAGLWVEDGGTLLIEGAEGRDVVFTHLADDSVGGNTEHLPQPEPLPEEAWGIRRAPGGTVRDNGFWQVRHHTMATNFITLTLHDAVAEERQGELWVPITLSGSREAPFSVDWVLEAGDASLEGDFHAPYAGTLMWGKSAEGTKFIRLPLVVDAEVEGRKTVTLRLTTVRGANIRNREATLTLYDSEPVVQMDCLAAAWQSEGNRPTSPVATVQTLSGDFQDSLIVDGQQAFRYSPRWQTEVAAEGRVAEIRCMRADGGDAQTLFRGAAGEEGEFLWHVRNLDDGEYLLTHRIVDGEGSVCASTSRLLRYIATVALHSGRIEADEAWSADKVHLVYGDVTVAAGVTLTIAPGAIVKFCDGTGLYSEDYTATTIATGVTFTHFADDTVGGDTNLDGGRSKPKYGAYVLGGHVVVDDTSDIRCRQPEVLGSLTGGQSLTLKRGNVYFVEKNITFGSGCTLTIEPGVVVKFYPGTSLTVGDGATLFAQGTRAAPIVFTSIKDDAHGGDTNGDGDATAPQPGDWHQIATKGTVFMEYVTLQYCSAKNNQGGLYVQGGATEARGSVFAHCAYDCCRVVGGTLQAENCVFTDSSIGAALSNGASTFVNCVFNNLTTAVRWAGGSYTNCIFSDIASVFMDSAGTQYSHCVYWNKPGFGPQSASFVGQNGNVWGDPCFVDPANGDFHILPGSIAVDMADGSVAPVTDFYGQPRMDVEEAANTGTVSANGAFPDAGIHELMPRTVTADIDLEVVSVEVPEAGQMGSEATFAWTVRNIGSKAAEGMWRDTLSLVNDAGQEIELGTFEVSGYIAPDGTKRTERTVLLPPMGEGAWRFKVVTNAYRDIYEGILVENNVLLSEAELNVSVYTLEGEETLYLQAGQWRVYRVPQQVESGYVASVRAGKPVCAAFSAMPFRGVPPSGASGVGSSFLIGPVGGWLYVANESEGEFAEVSVSLEKRLVVEGATPGIVPIGTRDVTLSVRGAGFADGLSVTLHRQGGSPVKASSLTFVTHSEVLAHFDLPDVSEGATFDLKVSDARREASLPKALLVSSQINLSGLKAELRIPDVMRSGRVYEGAILYENTSTESLPVPVFKVFVNRGEGMLAHIDAEAPWEKTLFAVGLGNGVTRGVLRPGERGRAPFRMKTDNNELSVSFATVVTEDLGTRASLWPTYPELARAVSAAATALAPTLPSVDYNVATYLDWAASETFGKPNGVLSGQLFFPDGQPVAGVELNLEGASGTMATPLTTDALGAFRVAELTPGTYRFVAGWLLSTNPGTVTVQGCVANFTGVCAPLGRLNGTVVDGRGAPVAEAIVKAIFGETFVETTTDSNGVWTLLGDFSAGGELRVRDASGFHADTCLEVAAVPKGTMRTLQVVMAETGTCSGTVKIVGASALPEGFTLVLESAGQRVASVAVAEDGAFAVGRLPVGTYGVSFPYGFAAQGPTSVVIRAGQETHLALTLLRTSPISMPPTYQPEGGSTTYTVTAPGATNVRWDFDGDGTTDAVGSTVDHSYATEGDYRPIVTYNQNGEEKVWTAPEPIVVCPTATMAKDTVSVYDGSGWEVVGQTTDEVRLRRTEDPAAKDSIEPGTHLLLWVRDNPAVAVTEVRQEGDVTICSVEDASLNDVFVPSRSGVDARKTSLHVAHIPVDKTWSYGFTTGVEDDKGFKFGPIGVSDELKAKVAFEVSISGSVDLWKTPSGLFFLTGSLSQRRTPSLTFTGAIKGRYTYGPKDLFSKTEWIPTPIGPIPVYVKVTFEGSVGAEVGGALSWKQTIWESASFNADASGLRTSNVHREETKSAFWGLDASPSFFVGAKLKLEGAVGVGMTYGSETVSFVEFKLGGEVSAGLDYKVTTEETEPDVAKISIDLGADFTLTLLKADLFGLEVSAVSCDLWSGSKALAELKSSTPMPKIHYDIPTKGAPGEIVLRPDAVCYEKWKVVAREWFLGESCLAEEEASEDEVSSVHLELPCLTMDNAEGKRDFYAGDITLRHYVCDREGKWTFLPDTWKAARRHISVFVEDGVTQPMDTEGVTVPQSCDPNEMAGPEGVGARRLVKPGEWMTYTLYFENKPDATGAAQEVRVSQKLDPRLDWSTFEMVDVAYRNQIESGLAGKASGKMESPLAGTPYKVRTEATCDVATGAAEWYLRIVDESTPDKWPANAYDGILPPNNNAHEGEGHITYQVKVREDAPHGARIDASASIVFDLNAPIVTDPAWWNTVAHAIDTAHFASTALEVQAGDGVAEVTVHGGSDDVATSVTLRVLGGTMEPGKEHTLAETTLLAWEKGDKKPKTLRIAFDPASLALGDKTILLGLENAQELALDATKKTCAITIRRRIPTLAWPEACAPSKELRAWVTEAAARQLAPDGTLVLASGVTLVTLEQARAFGVLPEIVSQEDGNLRMDVAFTLGVADVFPEREILQVTARIAVSRGFVMTPCTPSATFTLRGGTSLDETSWSERVPDTIGRAKVRSSHELLLPLCFRRGAKERYFFRLSASRSIQ